MAGWPRPAFTRLARAAARVGLDSHGQASRASESTGRRPRFSRLTVPRAKVRLHSPARAVVRLHRPHPGRHPAPIVLPTPQSFGPFLSSGLTGQRLGFSCFARGDSHSSPGPSPARRASGRESERVRELDRGRERGTQKEGHQAYLCQ